MTFQEALARITDPDKEDYYMTRSGGPRVELVQDTEPVHPCGSRVLGAALQVKGGRDGRLGADDLNASNWETDWIPF